MRIVEFENRIKVELEAKISGPKIELLSGDLRAYPMKGTSALLVQYIDSSLDFPNPVQRRRWGVRVYIGNKSLRREGAHQGSHELIDDVRDALTGLRLPELGDRDAMLYSTGDRYEFFDTERAVWWYSIGFTASGAYAKPATP